MDLNTVEDVIRRPSTPPGPDWRAGDAWLAGGTWLFSEPQPAVRRLIDLVALGWPSLVPTAQGLEISATCTIRELHEFEPPGDWPAAGLLRSGCEAFLASFKIWNAATVGGNICMSLPAGPMVTVTVALEATYRLWAADGTERTVAAKDFVVGNHRNVLRPGEILRSIHIPIDALRKAHAQRRFTLTALGRSTIYMVATRTPDAADLTLVLTAATSYPFVLHFDTAPDAHTLHDHVEAIPAHVWFADPNGTPEHREHLAKHYAEQLRTELASTR
ncbi:FAD binding domain-containing protein [Nocardia sp. AB354]|uniref:FAD binding domain-containing protein n=1 Tax=Nocardia sp. AB354 TaxID=3413283 RepID=UPI003C21FB93